MAKPTPVLRRIGETLLGFLVLAGILVGLTALPAAQLSRVSTIQSTRSTKVVCVPAAADASIYIDNVESAAPLGWGQLTDWRPVQKHQSAPMVAQGVDGPRGGAHNVSGSLATLVPCMRPISEGVLALPATADTELRIVNPDGTEAAVDLTLYGVDGEIQSLGARGIALAAYEERTIALSVLTAEATPVGVTVKASRGRAAVVAVTQTESRSSATVPSTLATNHLLPGIPAGATGATVVLANPSQERIVADLTVFGNTPAFTPAGGTDISIAPLSSVAVPLEASLAGEAAAVSVTSESPVIAGLSVVHQDAAEIAPVSAATELVTFTATGGTLQLTNPGSAPAKAEIVATGVEETEVTLSLDVGPGQTAVTELPTDAPNGQRVTVSSDQPLFGAVVEVGDSGTWVAPLEIPGVAVPEPIAAELDPSLR